MCESVKNIGTEATPSSVRTIKLNSNNDLSIQLKETLAKSEKIFRLRSMDTIIFDKYEERCKCPQVALCDDDNFELVFYKSLFNKMKQEDLKNTKLSNIEYYMAHTGDNLVRKYKESCSRCMKCNLNLIITDYNMGSASIDGIETSK
mmetsp:Transcript_41635/g.37025  ORF Transcript_41635/g.37025 Transcript_41635/m.37025 type:complete len:147 (+) Transcript_41635:92-532(+)